MGHIKKRFIITVVKCWIWIRWYGLPSIDAIRQLRNRLDRIEDCTCRTWNSSVCKAIFIIWYEKRSRVDLADVLQRVQIKLRAAPTRQSIRKGLYSTKVRPQIYWSYVEIERAYHKVGYRSVLPSRAARSAERETCL